MKDYNFYVYILTNWNNQVIYIGMTNDLERRLYEHKNKLVEGFTKKYNVSKLVYYEHTTDVQAALAREKEIKKWRREKKNNLVVSLNPNWQDLSLDWQVRQVSPTTRKNNASSG
jgi:putative endonuclease